MKLRVGRSASWGVGCLSIIPIFFVVLGGAWLFFSLARVAGQTTGSGLIVDVESNYNGDGDLIHRPVIEFTATDGRTYRFTGRTGGSSRPQVGGTIEVLYDPADPRGATEKTFGNLWLFPIVFGGIGLVLLTGMVYAGVRARARSETARAGANSVADAINRTRYGGDTPPQSPPRRADAESPPVGGTTAEFRRAEATISADGTIRYRIVAKDEAGNEYRSDLLDEDPTAVIMSLGNKVPLVERDGRWLVHFESDGR